LDPLALCTNISLAFTAATFPVVVAIPAGVLYLAAPPGKWLRRVYSVSTLAVLWLAIIYTTVYLIDQGSVSTYILAGFIPTLGILFTILFKMMQKVLSETMQKKRFNEAMAKT